MSLWRTAEWMGHISFFTKGCFIFPPHPSAVSSGIYFISKVSCFSLCSTIEVQSSYVYEHYTEVISMCTIMKTNMFKCASRVALWSQKLFPCMRNFGNWKITFSCRLVASWILFAWGTISGGLLACPLEVRCRETDLRMTLTTIYVFLAGPSKFCDPGCISGSTILQQDQTRV